MPRFGLILWLVVGLAPASARADPAHLVLGTSSPEEAARQRAARLAIGAPGRVDLLDRATLRMSGNLLFVARDDATGLLRALHQAAPPDLVGVILDSEDADWLGVLRFVGPGFVPADEFLGWPADELLDNLRRQVTTAQPGAEVRGWLQPPVYDQTYHTLRWAAQITTPNTPPDATGTAPYHAAMFGRQGYFQLDVNTVVDRLDEQKRDAEGVLDNLRFTSGHTYTDFEPGKDPIAPAGVAGVLGLESLQRLPWYQRFWLSDLAIPALAGAALVTGAALLALGQAWIALRRRRRR